MRDKFDDSFLLQFSQIRFYLIV